MAASRSRTRRLRALVAVLAAAGFAHSAWSQAVAFAITE